MGYSKKQIAIDFQKFYYFLPGSDIKIFSNGSKLAHRMVGAGFVLYQAGQQFLHSSFSLGLNTEVFDAEAEAALAGIQVATEFYTACFAANLWVCLDNLVAIYLLLLYTGLLQEVFIAFWILTSTWLLRGRLPYTNNSTVQICWVQDIQIS
jgi:hypothetical protein